MKPLKIEISKETAETILVIDTFTTRSKEEELIQVVTNGKRIKKAIAELASNIRKEIFKERTNRNG